MIEGSGSVSPTNGSECGSGRQKKIWIIRILIRNTDATYYLAVTPILPVAGHGEVSGYRAPRGVGALLAGGGGRGRPLALRRGHFAGLIKVPTFYSACQFWGIFFICFSILYSALLHLPPSDSTVPTDAGIEPRTVATSALAVRRSNH